MGGDALARMLVRCRPAYLRSIRILPAWSSGPVGRRTAKRVSERLEDASNELRAPSRQLIELPTRRASNKVHFIWHEDRRVERAGSTRPNGR